jgi:Tfp pilus assembly protein PilP
MNRNRRFELRIGGILVVVCLLLLNVLVWQFRKEPILRLVGVDPARSVSLGEHPPASSREQHEPRRAEAAVSSTAATMSRLHPLARAARHPFGSEQAKRLVSMPPAEPHPQASAPPQPKTITLEPLGYVEKADGRVEAIISLGERVQVVHEGEIFEDNFRVARISSSTVELVENSAPAAEPHLMAEVGQDVAQAPADKAGQTPPRPVPEVVSNTTAARQFDAASAASVSQPSVRQELGYVERADGRVEAIVAEGEHVRLAPGTKSFANSFRVPAPTPANLEVANASPPPINPPDSFGYESQPLQTSSSTQEAGVPPLVASGSESSTVGKLQGIRGNNGESESEQFGIIQPEPLADYSGGRFEVKIPEAVPPTSPAVGPTLPSDGRVTQSAVSTLGYVEKAGGEKEAIVEVLGQVYLVHEGEMFAEKYRALQVTPSSVEIVEESTRGASLPAEPERDSEAVRPISRLRAPPLSVGSSGTDPPMEVREAEELAAGEPVSPPRPPPELPVESWQRKKGVKTPRTALKSVRPAERSAQTDTRSPPYALKTAGFVEKASGETEAIVADEGGVYLVPGVEMCLDNPKIPNPLTAEAQPFMNRALTFPDLLPGMPNTACSQNTPQTHR